MKLNYDVTFLGEGTVPFEEHFNFVLEDYIGTTAKTKQPNWFQDLKLFIYDCANKKEFIKNNFNLLVGTGRDVNFKTAKGCPAFINFFKQSMALKTTADIYISVHSHEGLYSYRWVVKDPFWGIEEHAAEQVGSLSDRAIVLKLFSPLAWTCSEDTQYQFIDPFIKNDVPYRVCPGNVVQKKGAVARVNMPVFLPKKDAEYVIEAGSTLGYLHFDKPIRSIKRKDLSDEVKTYDYEVLLKENLKYMLGKK